MALVRKKNRILTVNDNAVHVYLNRGYDEIDESGKVIKSATAGKSVSVERYNALQKENETLSAQIETLKENESLDLTNGQIKSILDELGIEYGARDNKKTLVDLLIKATEDKE